MSDENIPTLQLTYEQFASVLRRWDPYTFIELNEMSRGFPVATRASRLECGNQVLPGAAEAARVELSDLAKLLWETLGAGPSDVDRVHDEFYAGRQAEHFKETYASPEHVAALIEEDYHDTLEPPTEMFMRLGKPAQMIIVRDGLLQQAVENYEKGKRDKETEEEAKELERQRRSEEERTINRNAKVLRELDKSQCVFCGKNLFSHLKYVRLSPNGYQVLERRHLRFDKEGLKEVVLACNSCASSLRGKTPEELGMTPKFGRFSSNDEVETSTGRE